MDVSDFAPKVLDNINKSWVEAQLLCGGMAFRGGRSVRVPPRSWDSRLIRAVAFRSGGLRCASPVVIT